MRKKGFTITEMAVTVSILGLIAMMGALVLVQIQRFYMQNSAQLAMQGETRAAFDLMTRSLRQAQSSTIVIDNLAGEKPYSRISFTKQSGVAVSFYAQEGVLYTSFGSNAKPLAKGISYAAFVFPRTDDAGLVSVALASARTPYAGGKKTLYMSVEKVRIQNE